MSDSGLMAPPASAPATATVLSSSPRAGRGFAKIYLGVIPDAGGDLVMLGQLFPPTVAVMRATEIELLHRVLKPDNHAPSKTPRPSIS